MMVAPGETPGFSYERRELTDEFNYVPAGVHDATPDTRGLGELEAVIERGLKTYMEVGKALASIRDRRLYKEKGFAKFEDYCREAWGWGRDYADRQIAASQAVEEMPTIVGIESPTRESHARPLTRIPDAEERAKVWREVRQEAEAEEKPVTAARVEAGVNRHLGEAPKRIVTQSTDGIEANVTNLIGGGFTPPNRVLTPEQNNFYETNRHVRKLRKLDCEKEAEEWLEAKDDGVSIGPHIRDAEFAEAYYRGLKEALQKLDKKHRRETGNLSVVGGDN